jgi:hypothetical protein
VGLKGTNPSQAKWMDIEKVRAHYPHLFTNYYQTFGGPKASKWGGLIQEDPQVQKMLKNKSYWNQMKPIPLCPSRRANFSHIFTSSNIDRMRKLSHSDQIPKQ